MVGLGVKSFGWQPKAGIWNEVQKLALGTWMVISLMRREPELKILSDIKPVGSATKVGDH